MFRMFSEKKKRKKKKKKKRRKERKGEHHHLLSTHTHTHCRTHPHTHARTRTHTREWQREGGRHTYSQSSEAGKVKSSESLSRHKYNKAKQRRNKKKMSNNSANTGGPQKTAPRAPKTWLPGGIRLPLKAVESLRSHEH